jgi:hypothetical protein
MHGQAASGESCVSSDTLWIKVKVDFQVYELDSSFSEYDPVVGSCEH